MNRFAVAASTFLVAVAGVTFAQTTSTTATSSGQIPITASQTLATQGPAKNIKIGAVQSRSPGKIVQAAQARHNSIIGSLGTSTSLSTGGTTTGSTSSGTGTSIGTSNTDLNSLISTLLSANTNGDLNGVITQLLGSGALSSLLAGGTTAKTLNSAGLDVPSNLSPEVLALLQSSGIDLNSLLGVSAADTAKPSLVSQTATTQPSSGTNATWLDRWTSTLLNTTFNSLTLAFRTTQFITAISDTVFLPFFRDIAAAQNPSASSSSSTQTSTDTGATSKTTSDSQDGSPVDSGTSGSVQQIAAPAIDGAASN